MGGPGSGPRPGGKGRKIFRKNRLAAHTLRSEKESIPTMEAFLHPSDVEKAKAEIHKRESGGLRAKNAQRAAMSRVIPGKKR